MENCYESYQFHKIAITFYIYQVSGNTINDTASTYEEAKQTCNVLGARLIHIRSEAMLKNIIESRPMQFSTNLGFLNFYPGSMVAIGLKYGQHDDHTSNVFYYSDSVLADEHFTEDDLATKFASQISLDNMWETGHPVDGYECVGFMNQKLLSYPCNDSTFFTNKYEKDQNKPALGYLCETKSLEFENRLDTTCIVPFKYQGKLYDSCSYEKVEGLNPDGSPWCASEVDEQGNAIPQKLKLCEDERRTILYGKGNGYSCPMPFVFDRVYYDHCTRKNNTLQSRYSQFYWCPDPRDVIGNNEYVVDGGIGACPEFLKPPDNGCQESYVPLEASTCIRVSAFPESFDDAKSKCESEGAFLFQHIDSDVNVSGIYMNRKKVQCQCELSQLL